MVTESRKRDALVSLIEALGEQAIVFTQFRATLAEIEHALRREGVPVAVFHGSLTAAEKDDAIRRFREGTRVLLSTEAGGEGRNLQFARNVINYDLPWNPMRLEQRIGRVYRLGQTRDVRVYNFAARDTVEGYVLELLTQKIRMFELVIGEMEMILGAIEHERSFDDLVFRIWATSRTRAEIDARFAALGGDMLSARRQYEGVKELDRTILDGAESVRRERAGAEGSGSKAGRERIAGGARDVGAIPPRATRRGRAGHGRG